MKIAQHLPMAAVVFGEMSALTLLAPMEWQTAVYVGAPAWAAWTVTGLVYSVAALAIVTSRLVPAALSLVWVSGIVGAIHAAGVKAKTEGVALDRMRVGTSIAVITIVVLAMAAVWYLGQVAHERTQARDAAERARAEDAQAERKTDQERAAQARRDHELKLLQERQEAAERTARLAAEAEALRAQREADQRAAEEASRAAEHARQMDLLRAQSEAQKATRQPRAEAPQKPRNAGSRLPVKRTAEAPQTDSDLQRRAKAKDDALTLLREGRDVDARTFAVAYYGTEEVTEKELAAARANLSTWRRKVADEQTQAVAQ